MGANTSDFRLLFLVYCLQRQPDGTYAALNRRYKPVGFVSTEWVDYQSFPVCFKFKRALSERQIVALSCKGDASPECIYLYNDSCIPTASDAHWRAYSDRLQRLAGYLVTY